MEDRGLGLSITLLTESTGIYYCVVPLRKECMMLKRVKGE
jgi:hypothetical protein